MGRGRTSVTSAGRIPIVAAIGAALMLASCAAATTESAGLTTDTATPSQVESTTASTAPPRSEPTSTTAPPAGSTSTSTTAPATSVAPSTSSTTTTTTIEPLPDPALPATNAAFDQLAASNDAVSMTVVRDGVDVLRRANGTTIGGGSATSDSPMVVASLSKLLTATAVARLVEVGLVDLTAPVPWGRMGIAPDAGWTGVTVRELLDHTSGMPVERALWFDGLGTCATTLPGLVAAPPTATRGEWTYSNGNYCALGLLVEAVTGRTLDVAVDGLALAPAGATGAHLSTDPLRPDDVPYALGVQRLARLGGAGSFLASTDDLAAMLTSITADDRQTLAWPAVMTDQYGWGHTGTVDGAKACAWVLERGRTVVVTTVAGGRPSTGGGVCDLTVPAIAADLGVAAGEPVRTPD